jgi:hypothetical protein
LPRPFSRLNREFDSELAQHSRPVKNGCGVRLPCVGVTRPILIDPMPGTDF